ncbi:hypothetical protein PIB30_016374 [Stylosanthes scabra]|uniref:Uncharacterized protein n=1 Tax=Stylosanthes scabra TaxID=79078 RepID=A0ABU6T742_9FABA|nr:hypothetical protein [Stylosanthes scabra]
METKISPRETDETAGDVETRISTVKNYEAWMTHGGTRLATTRHVSGGQRTVKEGGSGSDRGVRGRGFWVGMKTRVACGSIMGRNDMRVVSENSGSRSRVGLTWVNSNKN